MPKLNYCKMQKKELKEWSEKNGTDIIQISVKTISNTDMYCTSF